MGSFVFICLVFAAGFMLRGNDVLLERLGMDAFSIDAEQNPGATVSGDTFDSLAARIAEIQGIIEQDSLNSYSLDDATRSTIVDFLKETGDPYVQYYDVQSYAAYGANEADAVYGVGVLFGDYKNQAYALDVIPGSSAQTSGVREGDFVVAIDGERKDGGWPLPDAIKRIDREDGKTVVVTWRRPENVESPGGEEFTTTLVCAAAERENVVSRMRGENVGYIRVRQLNRDATANVSDAISKLTGKGAKAFVLDLRNCPGGYLTQAVELVSLFQGSGVVVQIKTKDNVTTRSATGSPLTTAPLAVIVNGNTAAAAEVVAASLQDNDRAVVVGQPTMGKGTVQMMRELTFGGAISYTAAEYLTPQGRSLDQAGVSPNVVAASGGSGATSDIQLELAVEAVSARAES
ncbi:MAG: S41 family peptidase [Coriobacteriia bacterium]|nr:S41 family peptidase [Coriobacteriia bacterium]